MRKLTPAEVVEAVRLRRDDHLIWREVAARYGLSIEGVRRQIDPAYRAARNAYQHKHKRKQRRGALRLPPRRPRVVGPPPGMTLTAWICGDPLPGRSALDVRRMRERTDPWFK